MGKEPLVKPYKLTMRMLRTLSMCLAIPLVKAAVERNGICTISGFLPFTLRGADHPDNMKDIGFSHMASLRLAVHHFNERNTAVVPELGNLEACDVNVIHPDHFQMDSAMGGHTGTKSIIEHLLYLEPGNSTLENILPCALVGPMTDIPTIEVSVVAQSLGIPVVSYGGFDLRSVSPHYHPFTSRTSPDFHAMAQATVQYLLYRGRNNYTAILYPLTDAGFQQRESLNIYLDFAGIQSRSFSYGSPSLTARDPRARALNAAKQIKDSGYRTIILATEESDVDIPLLADAATAAGLTNGDYYWIGLGDASVGHFFAAPKDVDKEQAEGRKSILSPDENQNENVTKLLQGSTVIRPVDRFSIDPHDKFLQAWKSQNSSFVDELNSIYPIEKGEPGYYAGNESYFQTKLPHFGSGFIYDAVMSIGFGACLDRVPGTVTSSVDHLKNIRASGFHGATGFVHFHSTVDTPGSRSAVGASYAALNVRSDPRHSIVLSDILEARDPTLSSWKKVEEHIFADGRTVPPDLLRDTPDQNHLDDTYRLYGFVLLGVGWAICLGVCIFVTVLRKHRVIKASQPIFLIQLAFGVMILLAPIIPLSYDESRGWSDKMLGMGCTSAIWLLVLGYITTYMALFSKLWRLHQVLQFRRTRVAIRNVLWPFYVMIVVVIIICVGYTSVLGGMHWERRILNPDTGESIGLCVSPPASSAWIIPGVIILAIPTILVVGIAWKTKDVDAAYSESSWIFTAILSQYQVLFISIPVLVILSTQSSEGRFIGYSLVLFCFSMTLLLLIMFPKFYAVFQSKNPTRKKATPRGSIHGGGVRISGFELATARPTDLVSTHTSDTECLSSLPRSFDASRLRQPSLPIRASKQNLTSAAGWSDDEN